MRKLSSETAIGDYLVYSCISHKNYGWYETSEIDLKVGIIVHSLGLSEEDYHNHFNCTWEEIESILLDNEITYEIVEE